MNDKIDEANGETATGVTKESVEERVAEWKRRLRSLYAEVRTWGKQNAWSVSDDATVGMNEELMQRTGVSPTNQPVLRLDGPKGYALFKPKGLWVIGANGRIDLYTSKGAYVLVDLADYGASPRWTIFRTSDKREGIAFTPEVIEGLV